MDNIMNETEIKSALREGIVEIVFTKKDGSEKTLFVTTNFADIPFDKQPQGTTKHLSDEVCRCFDVQIKEWRSFRWDSVISAEVPVIWS